jgi:hypothetical protein
MGRVVSVTTRPCFTPWKRTPGTHWTGSWVGSRAGLDTEDSGKILCPCRGSNPDRPVVQPVVRHYTAWANQAPYMLGRRLHLLNVHCYSYIYCVQTVVCFILPEARIGTELHLFYPQNESVFAWLLAELVVLPVHISLLYTLRHTKLSGDCFI